MKKPVRRIAMIAPHFEEYALRLACALAAHAEVMLVLDTSVLDAEFAARRRPGHARLHLRHSSFRTPRELARLLRDLHRFHPDVLHWQEPSGFIKAGFAAVTVTAAAPFMRTAVTIHDPVPHPGRDTRVAQRLARLRRYTRRRVDRLFLHGPACAAQYQTGYLRSDTPDPRVRLTDHGVLLAPDVPTAPPVAFRALMFGRMEAYKGLEVLTEALERLAAAGRPVPVEIAGSGPELDRLQSRLAAVPRVTIRNGFVPAATLIERVGEASCVVIPYVEASQSGVLAAAFANGRFVIATPVGGLADLVDDGGNSLVVSAGDPDALAGALTRAAGDPALCARLTSGARDSAATHMDWDGIAARLIADY